MKISKNIKRIYSLLIVLSLTLCGCALNEIDKENTVVSEQDLIDKDTSDINPEIETEKTVELNIIDDNYRNYYEIFVYSFYDSDGDGVGDLRGVDEKLSYISDMGFNGIWLMPIMPSTTYHKYDVIDYMDIDPEYGSIDDMRSLINNAHDKDINIIIDFVMNHTSSKNEWFLSACDYLRSLPTDSEPSEEECPYYGYYHFSKEKINGTYYPVEGTEYYYEGSFWSEMPDLNYSSDALKVEFEKIARFWVEDMGVDGFRMDATMHFEEGDSEFNKDVMNWIYEYCKSINPEFYMVSEVWASESTIADYYGSKTDSLFNFDAADAEGKIIKSANGKLSAEKFVKAMKDYEDTFSKAYPDYIDAVFITNHDMGRVANALQSNIDAIKFAGGLLMSMNGSTFVYYGEELGMKSKGTKDENKRLPMNWGESKGLTNGPKDADKDIEQKFPDAATQSMDENMILPYYKKTIQIRNQYPEIARGRISIDESMTEGDHALITKSYNDDTIVILYNTNTEESYDFNLKGTAYESMEIVGYLTTDSQSMVSMYESTISLPPRSIVYIK